MGIKSTISTHTSFEDIDAADDAGTGGVVSLSGASGLAFSAVAFGMATLAF